MGRAKKKPSGIGIRLPDKTGGLESLSRFLSKKINLKRVEPGRFNTELGP